MTTQPNETKPEINRVVGIDLSKKTFMVCWSPLKGKEKLRTYRLEGNEFQTFLSELKPTDRVLFEAGNQAFWFYDHLVEKAGEVYVLNPSRLAIIFKSTNKTDKHDATKIAYLGKSLQKDMLPLVRVPSEAQREVRSLLTEREQYTKSLTMLKNRFHARCASQGKTGYKRQDLKSQKKREQIIAEETNDQHQRQLKRLDQSMQVLEDQIKEVELDIQHMLQTFEHAALLSSIPGLGLIGIATILAYLGDVGDFETADQVVSFVGLAPRVSNSGKQNHTGSISKQGNTLIRKMLIQSVWVMVRYQYGGNILNHYERVKGRRGKGRAVVAGARKMMVVIYHMLKNGELFRDMDEAVYHRKMRQLKLKIS